MDSDGGGGSTLSQRMDPEPGMFPRGYGITSYTGGRKRCQGHLENLGEEMGDQILQEKQSRLSSSHIASGSQTPEHYVEHKIWLSHCSERKQAG